MDSGIGEPGIQKQKQKSAASIEKSIVMKKKDACIDQEGQNRTRQDVLRRSEGNHQCNSKLVFAASSWVDLAAPNHRLQIRQRHRSRDRAATQSLHGTVQDLPGEETEGMHNQNLPAETSPRKRIEEGKDATDG